jgi:N-acetyl-gamma-glutamyl-phosphate reductase
VAPFFLEAGKKVVDLSADFRIKDAAVYRQWYQEHTCPALMERSVYGLCEIYREEIRGACLVANPGCYPTSVLLPLVPLLRSGLVGKDGIIVDSKSGVSGAGRGLSLGTHICEAGESFSAYKVGRSHRHIPEIEQELLGGRIARDHRVQPLSSPSVGVLSTIYVSTTRRECSERTASSVSTRGLPLSAWWKSRRPPRLARGPTAAASCVKNRRPEGHDPERHRQPHLGASGRPSLAELQVGLDEAAS